MQSAMKPTARYTMGVLAQSGLDAVQCAGGIIFDRVACGWDVTVYTPDDPCFLALDILGAKSGDLESLLGEDASLPTVLIVSSGLHAADRRVQACVEAGAAMETVEVLLSGMSPSSDAAHCEGFSYPLGGAARAFKKCAVQAADVQIDTVGPIEHFRANAARSRPPTTAQRGLEA